MRPAPEEPRCECDAARGEHHKLLLGEHWQLEEAPDDTAWAFPPHVPYESRAMPARDRGHLSAEDRADGMRRVADMREALAPHLRNPEAERTKASRTREKADALASTLPASPLDEDF